MNKSSSFLLALGAAGAVAMSSCKPTQPSSEATSSPTPTPASSPAAAAATPAATTAAATPAAAEAGTGLKDPVAVVNGENITKAQLDEVFDNAVKQTGMNPADLTEEQKLEGYRQLLDELILEKLVAKAAEGVTVPDADVDAEIAKIKAGFPSEEAFNEQLTKVGQSPEKLKDVLSKSLQQQKWIESQIASKTEVPPDDAKKFYDENQKEFEEPNTVRASHILFLVNQDDSEDVVKQKLEAAKKAAARAKKEDFTKLAKELSEEPGAKESGGDLDFFSADRMVPEFSEAAFKLKKNQISEPVRTQFGWHVIKVTDTKPARTMPFDEVKDRLIAYLKAEKQRAAMQELLKALHDSAKIENNLPAPAAPSLPVGAPITIPGEAAPAAPATSAPAETVQPGNN